MRKSERIPFALSDFFSSRNCNSVSVGHNACSQLNSSNMAFLHFVFTREGGIKQWFIFTKKFPTNCRLYKMKWKITLICEPLHSLNSRRKAS